MSTAVQRRRGTTAQHAAFTGLLGEITVDTDKKALVVHDALTAGGFPQAPESASTAAGTSNTPAGNIAATNVQAAINELDSEKAPKDNPVFSGNVGIGGTPVARHSVINSSPASDSYSLYQNGTTGLTAADGFKVGVGADSMAYLWSFDANHIRFGTSNAERMRIDAAGNVGIGTAPSAKFHVEDNGGRGRFMVCYGGTSSSYLDSDRIAFRDSGAFERLVIDSTCIQVTHPIPLGYGPGAGGSVIQATSKSTTVTLNKPTGQITMHPASLAAGAIIQFTITNTLASASDGVVITTNDPATYSVRTASASGAIYVTLKNESGSPQAAAVVVDYKIIKGATS